MLTGLVTLPWWGYIVVTLVLTHITIAAVTLYLHRCQAHCALNLHPIVSHFFRFWLWTTTGMITKEWVAIHRKHHAKTETEEDPHSPHTKGIAKVFWQGAELYQEEAKNLETLEKYGHGTPNDWIERNLYARYSFIGLTTSFIVNFVLFGVIGITIWAVQMMWIPLNAAGIINGIGHYWGYRNFETEDGSTNITFLGFIIGGEELHNNHHAYPSSAKFSSKWWEFDIGWFYIQLLSLFSLAKVRRRAPQPTRQLNKDIIDLETAKAIVTSKLHVMAEYAHQVILPTFHTELPNFEERYKKLVSQMRTALVREDSRMKPLHREYLQELLQNSEALHTVYEMRRKLQDLWNETHASHERMIQAIIEWCKEAEATGIKVLEDFAQSLRGYALQPAV
ncbi:MAG: fatty acid desaturase [Gammaproteobacteria bacterium]|nr:fatty acid desaturase [Gammaproteobacteria bacterium]